MKEPLWKIGRDLIGLALIFYFIAYLIIGFQTAT